MLYNAVEVEVIKLAVCNVEGIGLNSKSVLLDSIVWLREHYEQTQDILYLRKAIWHIYAYLDMGYPYDEGEIEFCRILESLHMSKEEVFPFRKWGTKKIPLKKSNVRNLLGRWNGMLHSMKINDVVEDIIKNASESREGEYIYHCGKEIACDCNEQLWEHTFKLYVEHDGAMLHCVNDNKYYILDKVKKDDSDSSD